MTGRDARARDLIDSASTIAPSLIGLTLDEARAHVEATSGLSLRFAADLAEIERQQQRERIEPGYDAPYRHWALTADLRFGRITVWTRDGVVVRTDPDGGRS